MAKDLYIAEKPSVAQEFAKAMKLNARRMDGYLESEEAVAAAAVKAYLIDFTWQEAREQLRSVMKNTVLKIPPLHAKPELLKATIKGEKLAVLIDTAVREKTADMKEQRNVIEEGEAYDLWTIAIKALEVLAEPTSWRMFRRSFYASLPTATRN